MPRSINISLPRLHAAQKQILDQAQRFNVCCAGRRFGKNVLAMDRLIHTALQAKPAAWFGPSYKLISPVWRELQACLKPVIRDTSEQEKRLEIHGGGSIEMWSLDSPDAGRGRAYAMVVIDEAAIVVNLESAWTETIRPMLNDHQGSAWFTSTPKGVANYFHQLYSYGQDPLKTNWASWQMKTADNPFISPTDRTITHVSLPSPILATYGSWIGSATFPILCSFPGSAPSGTATKSRRFTRRKTIWAAH